MKSWDGNPAAFKPYEKHVKLICKSFMNRARAAYKHAEEAYKQQKDLLSYVTTAACDLEEHINGVYAWVMQNLPLKAIKWDDGRTLSQVATDHIDYVNKGLHSMHAEIVEFEKYAYQQARKKAFRYWRSPISGRQDLEAYTRQQREYIRVLYLESRKHYPYIRDKHRNRLMRLAMAEVERGNKPGRLGERHLLMGDLLKAGIPAADVVGPWWPRVQIPQIKSPMDYIDWVERHGEIPVQGRSQREYGQVVRDVKDYQSPTVEDWLSIIDLDSSDRELREACFQYYLRHKAAPSVKWAQERSNQLEEERAKKEVEGQIPEVEKWLKYSKIWRDTGKVVIPILPGPEWKVLGPEDARKLCETAKRDGLCVVDVISSFMDPPSYEVEDEESLQQLQKSEPRAGKLSDGLLEYCHGEGVVTIILCTDPKRRTVVGLDDNGDCTSEHHCTGVQNEVDKEAWKYFKAR